MPNNIKDNSFFKQFIKDLISSVGFNFIENNKMNEIQRNVYKKRENLIINIIMDWMINERPGDIYIASNIYNQKIEF